MAHHPFEKKLRPGGGSEFARKIGQGAALNDMHQPRLLQRQVDQDAHAALGGRRKEAMLCGPVEDGIVGLDEIDLIPVDKARQDVLLAAFMMGDADVANTAFLLPGLKQRHDGAGVHQSVALHEVDRIAPGAEL